MAIDSQAKRLSSAAVRRLPWMRRFAIPEPDSTIDAADRKQQGFTYSGIAADAPSAVTSTAGILLLGVG